MSVRDRYSCSYKGTIETWRDRCWQGVPLGSDPAGSSSLGTPMGLVFSVCKKQFGFKSIFLPPLNWGGSGYSCLTYCFPSESWLLPIPSAPSTVLVPVSLHDGKHMFCGPRAYRDSTVAEGQELKMPASFSWLIYDMCCWYCFTPP